MNQLHDIVAKKLNVGGKITFRKLEQTGDKKAKKIVVKSPAETKPKNKK